MAKPQKKNLKKRNHKLVEVEQWVIDYNKRKAKERRDRLKAHVKE